MLAGGVVQLQQLRSRRSPCAAPGSAPRRYARAPGRPTSRIRRKFSAAVHRTPQRVRRKLHQPLFIILLALEFGPRRRRPRYRRQIPAVRTRGISKARSRRAATWFGCGLDPSCGVARNSPRLHAQPDAIAEQTARKYGPASSKASRRRRLVLRPGSSATIRRGTNCGCPAGARLDTLAGWSSTLRGGPLCRIRPASSRSISPASSKQVSRSRVASRTGNPVSSRTIARCRATRPAAAGPGRGRLVHQQQFRLADKRPGDRGAQALRRRYSVRAQCGSFPQRKSFQHLFHPPVPLQALQSRPAGKANCRAGSCAGTMPNAAQRTRNAGGAAADSRAMRASNRISSSRMMRPLRGVTSPAMASRIASCPRPPARTAR